MKKGLRTKEVIFNKEKEQTGKVEYIYLGDRNTMPALRQQPCSAIRRNGKCIRGKNGAMLVQFENGNRSVIIGRLLRKQKQ